MTDNSIESKSPTEIRQTWNKYDIDNVPEEIKKLVYKDWQKTNKAQKCDVSRKYESKIKKFVFNKAIELGIKEDNSAVRKGIHDFCSKLGLDHISENVKGTYVLCISKPANWCWEFNKSDLQKKRDKKHNNNNAYYKARRVRECEGCGVTDETTELLSSYTGVGPYCEDCLDVFSDGYGGKLSDHKFEPLY